MINLLFLRYVLDKGFPHGTRSSRIYCMKHFTFIITITITLAIILLLADHLMCSVREPALQNGRVIKVSLDSGLRGWEPTLEVQACAVSIYVTLTLLSNCCCLRSNSKRSKRT